MAAEGLGQGHVDINQATFRAFVVMATIAFYNVVELMFLIFITFKRYSGLYFYSLTFASLGVFLHGLGFILKFFELTQYVYLSVTIITIGWYAMVTGQSLVLYARLHLVELNQTLRQRVLYLILVDALILHVPTTVLTFGSNSNDQAVVDQFQPAYNVMERIQMTWFTIQELLISVIYIRAATRFMQNTTSDARKKLLYYLLAVNVIIIAFDLALLGTEYSGLYIIQVMLKSMVYSIKLKLEFSVLGKLIALARPNNGGYTTFHPTSAPSRTSRAQSDGAIFSPTSPEPFELRKMSAFATNRTPANDEMIIMQSPNPNGYVRQREYKEW